MDSPHSFSLQRRSNKVAALFCLAWVIAGVWLFHREMSDGYFLAAVIIGMVWGTLRCFGFGERRWQNNVTVGLIVIIQLACYPWPQSHSSWASYGSQLLYALTFFFIALLEAFFVVWMKDCDERRDARKSGQSW